MKSIPRGPREFPRMSYPKNPENPPKKSKKFEKKIKKINFQH